MSNKQSFSFCRHHNVDTNKTKYAKHNFPTEKSDTEQFRLLNNVPLYHTSHGQATRTYSINETIDNHLRNRSSIQKRAQSADWLSKNISMVLEQLLMHYENSYLPTHGQGKITSFWYLRFSLFSLFSNRCSHCC